VLTESKEEQFKESGRMKVVRKGRAAIDAFCDKAEFVHVLEQGDTIYNAMLNYVRAIAAISQATQRSSSLVGV
jgi:hypothetical protein